MSGKVYLNPSVNLDPSCESCGVEIKGDAFVLTDDGYYLCMKCEDAWDAGDL